MNKLIRFFLVVIVIIYGVPLLLGKYYGIVSAIPLVPIFGFEKHNGATTMRIYKRDYVNFWLTPSVIGNYDKFGCRVGKWRYFNGTFDRGIEKEGYYDHCEKDGEWFEYNEDGKLWRITSYNGDNNWTSTGYYENGNIKFVENYKNGQKNGEEIKYYENGKIQIIENYKNGQKDGKQVYYYKNGNIQKIENYTYIKENGLWDATNKSGKWIWYKENGDIEKTETY